MFKNTIWTASCIISIIHPQDDENQCQREKDLHFVLLIKIHITENQSMIQEMPVRLTSLTKKFWGFLDFHKTIFGSIHAWLIKI